MNYLEFIRPSWKKIIIFLLYFLPTIWIVNIIIAQLWIFYVNYYIYFIIIVLISYSFSCYINNIYSNNNKIFNKFILFGILQTIGLLLVYYFILGFEFMLL